MRILSVGIDVPNKTAGSQKRIYHLTKALAASGHKLHRINMIFQGDGSQLEDVERLGVLCHPAFPQEQASSNPAPAMRRLHRKLAASIDFRWKSLRAVFDTLPKAAKPHWLAPLRQELLSVLQRESFDLVIIEHEHNALLADVIPAEIPIILDAHNVLSSMAERDYRMSGRQYGLSLFRMSEWVQPGKLRRFERKLLTRYDAVIVMSELEAQHLCASTRQEFVGRVVVVNNGVDIDSYRSLSDPPDDDQVVFTGLMSWWPNEDAMNWFLREIWPLVLRSRPGAHLNIVGMEPSQSLYRLASEAGASVNVTGRVDEVTPYFESADVFIAPLRLGGGTRLKILEAAAMRRPIVATTMAAEGLNGFLNGEQLLLRDTSASFADAIVSLFQDKALSNRLASAARVSVEQHYDWQMLGQEFEALVTRFTPATKRQDFCANLLDE